MAYRPDNLSLQSQSIAGVRHWSYYTDTGNTIASVAGTDFFTDGKAKGMKVGDPVFVSSPGGQSARMTVTALNADTGTPSASVGDTG